VLVADYGFERRGFNTTLFKVSAMHNGVVDAYRMILKPRQAIEFPVFRGHTKPHR
jgi:hypothetical protein